MNIYEYADWSEVSDWAKDAVEKAINRGILRGDENKKLHPQEAVTREQLCVILERLGMI